jgi:thymidylate kinase
MKIVVAVEGIDGSGKSSVAQLVEELCASHKQPFTRIGRRTGLVNPAITKLTHVLGRESSHLTAQAEMFVRLGREAQRAHLASTVSTGIVLLDRFVLSVLAVARFHNQDAEQIYKHLKQIMVRADLHATVLVECPLEVAWSRVLVRGGSRSGQSENSRRVMRRMAQYMEEDYRRGNLTGRQWPIDNAGSLAGTAEQLADYLVPYFR